LAQNLEPFGFEININGAKVFARPDALCGGCLSDGEVDAAIGFLKHRLDVLAPQMKKAIRRQAAEPLGLI
jgi:hypothetical protein